MKFGDAHRLVLLIKVVDIAVENLHEEFYRHRGVHAGICYTESTLQTLEHALTIAIELQ